MKYCEHKGSKNSQQTKAQWKKIMSKIMHMKI
jgi:hypothetical protein